MHVVDMIRKLSGRLIPDVIKELIPQLKAQISLGNRQSFP